MTLLRFLFRFKYVYIKKDWFFPQKTHMCVVYGKPASLHLEDDNWLAAWAHLSMTICEQNICKNRCVSMYASVPQLLN